MANKITMQKSVRQQKENIRKAVGKPWATHGIMDVVRPTGEVVTVVYTLYSGEYGNVYHVLHINAAPLRTPSGIDIESVVRCASGYGVKPSQIVDIY